MQLCARARIESELIIAMSKYIQLRNSSPYLYFPIEEQSDLIERSWPYGRLAP